MSSAIINLPRPTCPSLGSFQPPWLVTSIVKFPSSPWEAETVTGLRTLRARSRLRQPRVWRARPRLVRPLSCSSDRARTQASGAVHEAPSGRGGEWRRTRSRLPSGRREGFLTRLRVLDRVEHPADFEGATDDRRRVQLQAKCLSQLPRTLVRVEQHAKDRGATNLANEKSAPMRSSLTTSEPRRSLTSVRVARSCSPEKTTTDVAAAGRSI